MMILYKGGQQINFYIGLLFLLPLLANISAVRAELLKSAAEPDYPPLSMADENGKAMGFSVELLNAVSKTMEHDILFNVSPWSEIKQELANNKIDVLPLVGRTPERESVFDFTIPYLTIHGTIVVRKGNKDIHNIEDLKGRRIGVMKGDVAEEFLIRENLNDNLTSTKNFDIALQQLNSGLVDAVVMQKLVALQLINKLKLDNLETRNKLSGMRTDWCFAVAEGDKSLLSELNEGLSIVIANGTYAKLRQKWLGILEPDNTTTYLLIAGITTIVVFLVSLLIAYVWQNSLRRRVISSTKELEFYKNDLELRVETRTIELKSERELLNKILENAAAIIIVLDNKGHILRLNPAAEEITGFSFNELHNQPIWEWLIPPEQFDGIKQVFNNLTQEGLDSSYENHLMKKDGDRVLVTWNNSTITNETGGVQYVISVGIDISERQATQKALEEAKNVANKANIAKSEFLSRMSHELRTPMNAILGFGQMFEFNAENLNKVQKGNIKEIIDAGQHLLFLINEILDLAQIESGKLKVSKESVSVDKVLQECVSLMQPEITSQQVELINNISGKGYNVNADFNRVKQVLLNLLSNALKYNHTHGSVTLNSKLISNSARLNHIDGNIIPENEQYLRICVTNTGKSLTENEISRLFVAFERLDAAKNVEGAGIGLVISKHLVELMGGMIGVESDENKGNTFWIELAVQQE